MHWCEFCLVGWSHRKVQHFVTGNRTWKTAVLTVGLCCLLEALGYNFGCDKELFTVLTCLLFLFLNREALIWCLFFNWGWRLVLVLIFYWSILGHNYLFLGFTTIPIGSSATSSIIFGFWYKKWERILRLFRAITFLCLFLKLECLCILVNLVLFL